MVDILRVVAGLELLTLTLGFLAFTLLFHVLSDWQSTSMGRHFMSLMASCDLVLAWSLIALWVQPSLVVRIGVAVVLYGGLTFIVWRQVRILIKMQILARNKATDTQRVMEESNGTQPS